MPVKKPQTIYQIKVNLKEVRPPIWRRLLIPAHTSLPELHDILQTVMGWLDYHLHAYTINGQSYGDPADDEFGELGTKDEKRFHLDQFGLEEGSSFTYEYDFGDGWELTLLIEKVLPAEEGKVYPVCIKGKRAGPPDDSGGPWGYQEMLETLKDPSNDQYEDIQEWLPEGFDPEEFNLESMNAVLAETGGKKKPRKVKRSDQEMEELDDFDLAMELLAMGEQGGIEKKVAEFMEPERWKKLVTPENEASAGDLAICKDAAAMLTYLKENKVTGTQSTGNFPLKAVAEIAARFVHPPQLETRIGEKVYKIRSEDEVSPLMFVHVLLSGAGLLDGGTNLRWKLTDAGEEFLITEPLGQLWLLFVVWWLGSDWTSISPMLEIQSNIQENFRVALIDLLLALQPDDEVPYPEFADRLLEKIGFRNESGDQGFMRDGLHLAIEENIMYPLFYLGVFKTKSGPTPADQDGIPHLASFHLTPLGMGLLELLRRLKKSDNSVIPLMEDLKGLS